MVPRLPIIVAATALLRRVRPGLRLSARPDRSPLLLRPRGDHAHRLEPLDPRSIVFPDADHPLCSRIGRTPSVAVGCWAASAPASRFFLLVLAYPKGIGMGTSKLTFFLGTGSARRRRRASSSSFSRAPSQQYSYIIMHRPTSPEAGDPAFGPFLALERRSRCWRGTRSWFVLVVKIQVDEPRASPLRADSSRRRALRRTTPRAPLGLRAGAESGAPRRPRTRYAHRRASPGTGRPVRATMYSSPVPAPGGSDRTVDARAPGGCTRLPEGRRGAGRGTDPPRLLGPRALARRHRPRARSTARSRRSTAAA